MHGLDVFLMSSTRFYFVNFNMLLTTMKKIFLLALSVSAQKSLNDTLASPQTNTTEATNYTRGIIPNQLGCVLVRNANGLVQYCFKNQSAVCGSEVGFGECPRAGATTRACDETFSSYNNATKTCSLTRDTTCVQRGTKKSRKKVAPRRWICVKNKNNTEMVLGDIGTSFHPNVKQTGSNDTKKRPPTPDVATQNRSIQEQPIAFMSNVNVSVSAVETRENVERSSSSSSYVPVVLVMAGIAIIAAVLFVAHRRRHTSEAVNGLVTPPCPHPSIIGGKPGALTPALMRAHVQETIL
jgi:hypothetical protein